MQIKHDIAETAKVIGHVAEDIVAPHPIVEREIIVPSAEGPLVEVVPADEWPERPIVIR